MAEASATITAGPAPRAGSQRERLCTLPGSAEPDVRLAPGEWAGWRPARFPAADTRQRWHAVPADGASAGKRLIPSATLIGIMNADGMEDSLEQRDPKVGAQIRQSDKDIAAGRIRPAQELLQDLSAATVGSSRRRSK